MSQTYKDLKVYKLAIILAGEIEKMTFTLPGTERFRYVDQILRSSRSIAANIAEGYGRKDYKKDFIKFLTYSKSSCDETKVHLFMIYNSKLINSITFNDLDNKCRDLSVRIYNYISVIESNDLLHR